MILEFAQLSTYNGLLSNYISFYFNGITTVVIKKFKKASYRYLYHGLKKHFGKLDGYVKLALKISYVCSYYTF